ncbi:MAG: imidazole glycerol phosphate synthase subunit HisH [Pseudomonadota bacterium]
MKTIALIDYGSGNIHSAARALRVAANNAKKTREIKVTSDPDALRYADRIVLPGVGHFADCAANLRAKDGLIDALEAEVLEGGKPFLGICVGMQLMAARGLEDGETPGLGWIGGDVAEITPGPGHPVPHMGWNTLITDRQHPVLAGLGEDPHVYFVHSYAFQTEDRGHTLAETDYGTHFAAAVGRDNLFGTQFHPEKSQQAGLKLLSNFILWQP